MSRSEDPIGSGHGGAAPPPADDPRVLLRSGIRRSQIVDAARGLLAERGDAATSVDAIAERAGLAKSTLYAYFDGKEAILSACVDAARDELLRRCSPPAGPYRARAPSTTSAARTRASSP
jgi:AcrR family transcriptional regulator